MGKKQKKSDKSSFSIHCRHDKLFKRALQNKDVARSFVEAHIADDIKSIIDLNSIESAKDNFIDDSFKEHICDVLLSAKINGKTGYVLLLLEHQSRPDRWIAFRLFRYIINIYSLYLKKHKKIKYFPLIYSAVVYNGKAKYTAPLSFFNLFEDSNLAKKIWMENYKLIDVNKIEDSEFKSLGLIGPLEYMLQQREDDYKVKLKKMIHDLKLSDQIVGTQYFIDLLQYALTYIGKDDKFEVAKIVESGLNKDKDGNIVISILEDSWNQGWAEGEAVGEARGEARGEATGINKGIRLVALNMLKIGAAINLITAATGMSAKEIKELQERELIKE